MNVQDFYLTFPLKELEIEKIIIQKKKIHLFLVSSLHSLYIGNGLRGDFMSDFPYEFIFSFKNNLGIDSATFLNPHIQEYIYQNNALLIVFNDYKIILNEQKIKIKKE